MADRPAKLAKLQSLRSRLPYISQTALSSLLRVAAHEPLPIGSSRSDIRAARDTAVQHLTPYGPVHQHIEVTGKSDTPVKLEVQHPFAMLHKVCSVSNCMSNLVARVAEANPPSVASPWKLILYTDEVLPGNQLAYRNARKMWAIYWSILEFGSALADEDRAPA